MEALPWNPAAEATDVTAAQSVQDRGRIKHNSYAFRELTSCIDVRLHRGVARQSTDGLQAHDEIVTAGWSCHPFRD